MSEEQIVVSNVENLWPYESAQQLKNMNINPEELENRFPETNFSWNKNYQKNKIYYSLRIQTDPLFIFNPENCKDLEKMIDYLSSKKLTFAMLGGRSSPQLLSPEVLINMQKFKHLKNKENKLTMGSATTQGEIYKFLFDSKYKFNGVNGSTIGSGSLTTIGGSSIFKRTLGLVIDSVKSFKITLPPNREHDFSRTVKVSQKKNKELFYALLGGSASNFGIISEIKIKIYKIHRIVSYNLPVDEKDLVKKINLWKETAPNRPPNYNETFYVKSDNGKLFGVLSGYYIVHENQTDDEAEDIVKNELRYMGKNIQITTSNYNDTYKTSLNLIGFNAFSIYQAIYTVDFSSNYIYEKMKEAKELNGVCFYAIELMGGKIKSPLAEEKSSFPYRNTNFYIVIGSQWLSQTNNQSFENWVRSIDRHYLDAKKGFYCGFPIAFTELSDSTNGEIYFGKNYKKLLKIKEYYDPYNILTPTGTLA